MNKMTENEIKQLFNAWRVVVMKVDMGFAHEVTIYTNPNDMDEWKAFKIDDELLEEYDDENYEEVVLGTFWSLYNEGFFDEI